MATATLEDRAAALQLLARELKLTVRQRLIAEVVVQNPDMNHAEAARAATYAGNSDNALAVQASQALALPKVQAYMWALMQQSKSYALQHTAGSVCSTAEILQRMSTRARTSIEHFLVFDHAGQAKDEEKRDPDKRLKEAFVIDLRGAIERGWGECVEGLSFDKDGRPNIKLTNGREALKQLGEWFRIGDEARGEPEEIRQARELMARILSNPELARAADAVALAVERERYTLTVQKGK